MAPDIEELKLFATALKMGSAFTSVDKLAFKWLERDNEGRAWRDLNPKELEEDEKREWYELHDSWERANRDLRGKIERFEKDPYSNGASPILRYERIVESMGVRGKLFLGLNSHQAKGYRIIELDYPRWLEQLMQTDSDVFRSENLSEGEVYALVPSRGIDQEKLSVLRNDFWDAMKAAGVPAFEKRGEVTQLMAEFSSRLEKTIDTRLPFDANVLRIQALEEAIKREHALAVPATRAISVTSPKVILGDKVAPAPKFSVNERVFYKGAFYTVLSREFSSREKIWRYELSAPGTIIIKPESEITPSKIPAAPAAEKPSKEEAEEEKKLEKEAEEEREIPEEPEQTVYVKVIVTGGVPANDKGEMKIETPEFTLMATTYEEFAKYSKLTADPWAEEQMWQRPIVAAFGVKTLNDILKDAEIELDLVEDLEASFGQEWDNIREALAENPAPFNKFARFIIKWRPDDLFWTETASDTHDVYMHKYTKEELLNLSKHSLQVIAKVKDLPTGSDQGALIDSIIAFNPETAGEIAYSNLKVPPSTPSPINPSVNVPIKQPAWQSGMPLTDEQIEQAKEDAIQHIANEAIPRTVLMVYDQQGKDAALRVLKEQVMNWGQVGPGEPDVRGTPKGVEVSNAIMNPTDVKIISYPDLLDYILRWNELKAQAYNKPPAPVTPVPVEKPAAAPTVVTKPTAVTQPPTPAPRPTKILSSEDMRLLQDYWNTQFIRALGKVPAGFSSVFRIEFQEVKTLPFAEAKAAILAAADREIASIEQMQRARATIRQGEKIKPLAPPKMPPGRPRSEVPSEEEEEGGIPLGVGGERPPSLFPSGPLGHGRFMPFPRGPTSEERARLWNVFCTQIGAYCNDYQRQFTDYIEKSQFLSWEDMQEQFKFFVDTIKEGEDLPPLVQWRRKLTTPTGLRGELRELEPSPEAAKLTAQQIEEEEKNAVKRQRILISHWAAALIHQARYYNKVKTMSDLYNEVVERGVIDASIPEEIFMPIAKEAIREIYSQPLRPTEMVKTDDEEEEVEKLNLAKVPFVDISQQEIDSFLATA